MSSGVSVVSQNNDPVLDNLAVLVDPVRFQARVQELQKTTADATQAWLRLRTAETAEAMLKDATEKHASAEACLNKATKEASDRLNKAAKDAVDIVEAAHKEAEEGLKVARGEAAKAAEQARKLSTTADARVQEAAAKTIEAKRLMEQARLFDASLQEKADQLAKHQFALEQREQQVQEKIQALNAVASMLGIK